MIRGIWNITYTNESSDSIYCLYGNQINPQYYLCKRFFTNKHPEYRNFIDIQPFNEIVSVDSMLINKDMVLNKAQANAIKTNNNEQILCVYCMLDKNGDVDNSFLEEISNDDFCFCGYDVADNHQISALTNCAGGFSNAFSYLDLNKYGIIQEYFLAKEIQKKLIDEYPDEEHAYCAIYAIWRKA